MREKCMFVLAGSNSVLANHILPVLRDRYQVCAFDQETGDIEDETFLGKLFDETSPEVFINCVQLGNIEECEYKREVAYRINGFAPGKIARLCKEKNALYVHFSTSHIFDGKKKSPYSETDEPNPISVYGDSRLMGEKHILESGCRYLIIRLYAVYGKGKSFLHDKFTRMTIDGSLQVIKNRFISPTYALDVASALNMLIDQKKEGVYHFANSGKATSLDFIRAAIDYYHKYSGKDLNISIYETDYEEYISPVERPLNNMLSIDKLVLETGINVRDWKKALDDFMKNNFFNL